MSGVLVETGWWQASDGNWYPPELYPSPPEPPRLAARLAPHRKKLFVAALALIALGGFAAVTVSYRSSADKWKQREHAQHTRADGLDKDLTSAKKSVDVLNADLTDVRAWSKEAAGALTDYATCVKDIEDLGNRIPDAVRSGNTAGLDSDARRIGLECVDALNQGTGLHDPPAGTS